MENSPESHKPVEINDLRLLMILWSGGISRVQPDAERPLRAGKGEISSLAGLD